MQKWLGKAHPASRPRRVAKLTFAEGVEPNVEVGAGVSVEVSDVESHGRPVTKTGDGSLVLKFVVPEDMATCDSIVVSGGTHLLDCSGGMASDDLVYYRFDPNVPDKIQTKAPYAEYGNDTVEVVRMWEADSRKVNGNTLRLESLGCAAAGVSDGRASLTNPTLQTVCFPVGDMKVVDYGPYSGYSKANQNQQSAAATVMIGSAYGSLTIRDSFMIWKDLHDGGSSTYGNMFYGVAPWGSTPYERGSDWAFLNKDTGIRAALACGYISLDGVQVPYYTPVPEGFHLLSFSPTNSTTFSRIANHCNGNLNQRSLGGCAIGEMIGFTNELPRSTHRYVAAKLMKKWFGVNMMTNVVEAGSIVLGGAGTLQVVKSAEADGTAVCCPLISGDGRIVADSVYGVTSLSFAFRGARVCDSVTIDGSLSLGESGMVKVTVPAGLRVLPGDYTLISAGSIIGGFAGWTLSVDGAISERCTFVADGGTLTLRVAKAGSVVIVH